MEWKKEYSLGLEEIDAQHKQLLAAFSRIEASIAAGQNWKSTYYAVDALGDLARMHFAFEEGLMRLFGFADIELHQRQHQSFFERLRAMESHSLKETAETEMVQFLKDWLTRHILGTDREYAKHILAGAEVVRAS
jgi:hemerythrin-like metal-binding protein